MKRIIYISIFAVMIFFTIYLITEYLRLDGMLQLEKKLIKTQAELLLNDQLSIEFTRSSDERYDLLEREGFLTNVEIWGGVKEKKP